MKIIIGFLLTITISFASGFMSADMIHDASAKMITNYVVGDCLSNGLFYERILEIKKGQITREAKYVLLPTIQGRLSAPDTTAAWIVHEDYVKVAGSNCL
jgi:hypothetical protein